MSHRLHVVMMLAVLALSLPAAAQSNRAAPPPPPPEGERDREPAREWPAYQVIVQRNIFSRTARRPAPIRPPEPSRPAPPPRENPPTPVEPPAPAAPPDPADAFLFIGVGVVGERPRAIVEDRTTGQVSALRPGDALAGRTIVSISLDAIEVEAEDDQRREIAPGHTLSGALPSEVQPPAPANTSAAAPGSESGSGTAGTPGNSEASAGGASGGGASEGGASGGGDPATESLLERLRRRRQQEFAP